MELPSKNETNVDAIIRSYFKCANCQSSLRNIETFRRADSKVLQIITCSNCNYKWKEIWLRGANSKNLIYGLKVVKKVRGDNLLYILSTR